MASSRVRHMRRTDPARHGRSLVGFMAVRFLLRWEPARRRGGTEVMVTREELKRVNDSIRSVEIERKTKNGGVKKTNYVLVNDRVQAFRDILPDGVIKTSILQIDDKAVTIQATISDAEGHVLAQGIAHEDKDAGLINKTSYVENCETSAVGRALGFLGIGISEAISTAEEQERALQQQTALEQISKKEAKALADICKPNQIAYFCEFYHVNSLEELTRQQYVDTVFQLKLKAEKAEAAK